MERDVISRVVATVGGAGRGRPPLTSAWHYVSFNQG